MKEIIEPKTLSGFMELMPQEQVLFEKIKKQMEEVYINYGFYPLDTPILEDSRILLAKAGGETEKQVYRFNKGDTDITMRFDLTVPLAKYVAKNYSEISFPFKRYQIGKVYRGERAQKGRFREFYQADIDIIGDTKLSIVNDAELPSIIYSLFISLGIEDFVIRINNRKILNGLYKILNIQNDAVEIMRVIDKIDKIGYSNVLNELIKIGVCLNSAEELMRIITASGDIDNTLKMLEVFLGKNDEFDQGFVELKKVTDYICEFGVPKDYYEIDLTIARGLDYYTGTVYETLIRNHPEYGSVCSGGRYDNLAEYYTKRNLPGVGISIGLTRLFYLLMENNFLNRKLGTVVDAIVIPMIDDMGIAIRVASEMRKCGVCTQIYFEDGKMKKKLGYGNKLSVPYCILIGEDEVNCDSVTVKDMFSGMQLTCSLGEAIKMINAKKKTNECDKIITMK